MATPRKLLPDGSPVPKGRPKGTDTMAAYESVSVEPRVKKARKKGWIQTQGVAQVIKKDPNIKTPPESREQREAFEKYFSLGDHRSLPRLAEMLGEKQGTLTSWSSKYAWTKRIIEREMGFGESVALEPIPVQIEKRKFSLNVIDKILRDTVEMDKTGKILSCDVKAKTPADIRTLLTLREEILNPVKDAKGSGGSQINAENAVFIIKK